MCGVLLKTFGTRACFGGASSSAQLGEGQLVFAAESVDRYT
jgi:hypothetical protein